MNKGVKDSLRKREGKTEVSLTLILSQFFFALAGYPRHGRI